jgi:RNA polymerase sigma-70 factor (ECF subfamily)
VMSRLHRGRARLRKALGEYASEQGVGKNTGAKSAKAAASARSTKSEEDAR